MGQGSDDAPVAGDHEATNKILWRHIVQLLEHFDTVHIFVASYDPRTKDTYALCQGEGNYHARFGCVYNWVEQQRQMMRESASAINADDDEDDGDDAN